MKSNKRMAVPIHVLKERTDLGVEVRCIGNKELKEQKAIDEAHRDDHYIFILQEGGEARFIVDFKEIHTIGANLVCILPGQVHHYISSVGSGWFLAVETSLLSSEIRNDIESQQFNTAIALSAEYLKICRDSLQVILQYVQLVKRDLLYSEKSISALIGGFTSIVSEIVKQSCENEQLANNRASVILSTFRKALSANFAVTKKPSDYANILCLSPSYLNEVVKRTTGFPVTYWIREEVMVEAKRLLYYTDMTVKEIAAKLGYEDYAYFIRLFKRDTSFSPNQFRKKYRK